MRRGRGRGLGSGYDLDLDGMDEDDGEADDEFGGRKGKIGAMRIDYGGDWLWEGGGR